MWAPILPNITENTKGYCVLSRNIAANKWHTEINHAHGLSHTSQMKRGERLYKQCHKPQNKQVFKEV